MKNAYQEYGSGPTLVMLHGNGEDGSYYKEQVAHFKEKYHVATVDTRGHGKSPRGKAPFTLAQFAKDLKRFLDSHGWKRVILLGFSDGANIAMIFSIKYPQYVSRLILNGGNLYPSGVRMVYQIPIICEYVRLRLRSLVDKSVIRKKERYDLMVNQPHIKTKYLKRLTMPVLVIAGTHDMIRCSHTRKIYHHIPGAELVMMEGDHFIAAKKSRQFNEEVDRFLIEADWKEVECGDQAL